MNNYPTQAEYNNLLAQLRNLTPEELLLLYIEAKTGTQEDVDKLPVEILEAIYNLGAELNRLSGDRIIGNLPTI